MPINHISSPTVIAPIDRMSLEVSWVRTGATEINDTVNPSSSAFNMFKDGSNCLEGNEELRALSHL